jgi:uncharacterized protein (DUF1501 family)
MHRRRFMKVAGIAGLSVMAPLALRDRDARAGNMKYGGPYWIMVNAGGGWDATMLTDPKGGTMGDKSSVDQAYAAGTEGHAGPEIQYAPISYSSNGTLVQSAQKFWDAHHQRMLVLNGVDTTTNNHDAGSRTTWSGQLTEGFPSFAAMVAASASTAQPVPLAYVSNGGYDVTAGILSLTRVGSPDSLNRLAFTNEADPSNAKTDYYHTLNTATRIQAAQSGRIQALAQHQSLPKVASAMNTLYLSRESNSGLAALGQELKGVNLVSTNDFPDLMGAGGLNDLTGLMQQAQLALLCFKAGVAVSANLNFGGFDTHSNNDQQQERQLMVLLRGLDYLFNEIDAMGLTNEVYVLVGSDFSRTPYYNAGNGKDHWNITSMMFAGPKIAGDRVLGGTDATFTSIPLDASSLKPSAGGVRIQTTDVHVALRRLAGLTGSALDTEFPLPPSVMPIFG